METVTGFGSLLVLYGLDHLNFHHERYKTTRNLTNKHHNDLNLGMNVTGDLIAFFTLKNRRINNDHYRKGAFPAILPEKEDVEEDLIGQHEDSDPSIEPTYQVFSPSFNLFLGVYLSIIGDF